jgi:hypothetical protein
MRPPETSRWFAETAADILAQAAEAEKRIGDRRNKEFDSTVTDLKILVNLALFHARRIQAAGCRVEINPKRWYDGSLSDGLHLRPGGSWQGDSSVSI